MAVLTSVNAEGNVEFLEEFLKEQRRLDDEGMEVESVNSKVCRKYLRYIISVFIIMLQCINRAN